jgi:hypothetical protein
MDFVIQRAFEGPLKQEGFQKKSGSWYLNGFETVVVANLQKSNYGEQYYVNLAIWLKALGDDLFPKEHKCHIRLRLGSLVGQQPLRCFDMDDTSITEAARDTSIRTVVEREVIPFLKECSTLKGIRRHLDDGKLRSGFVHRQVLDLLTNNPGLCSGKDEGTVDKKV